MYVILSPCNEKVCNMTLGLCFLYAAKDFQSRRHEKCNIIVKVTGTVVA